MFDKRIFEGIERQHNVPQSVRLIFLARLAKDKGIYQLLEAFLTISRRYPDMSLEIAGDGLEKENLHQWLN